MKLQILNGAIDASWILTIAFTVIGYFMIRTLLKMETRLEKHDGQITKITLILVQMLTKLGVEDATYNNLIKEFSDKS